MIEALRGRIEAVCDELFDALPPNGEFDLISSIAQPLPVRVICDVLGLPPEDYAQTNLWTDALTIIVVPVTR